MPLTLDERSAGHTYRPSPKRKRQDSTSISAADITFAPDLNSSQTLLSEPTPSLSSSPPPASAAPLLVQTISHEEQDTCNGAESPRSTVARKLEGLDLAVRSPEPIPILSFGAPHGAEKKKKVKLDPEQPYSDTELDLISARAGSPTKEAFPARSAPVKITKVRRSKSPPPSRLPLDAEASINWWSDAEITGHLGLDPDDDGYGINGIGFRPTPAMAAARSVRRRRQVDEWRSRELREERRRRADARRRAAAAAAAAGDDPGGTGSASVKRSVRFAT